MSDPTPRGSSAISDGTVVKIRLGSLLAATGFLLGATVWGTLMFAKVGRLEERLESLEKSMSLLLMQNGPATTASTKPVPGAIP